MSDEFVRGGIVNYYREGVVELRDGGEYIGEGVGCNGLSKKGRRCHCSSGGQGIGNVEILFFQYSWHNFGFESTSTRTGHSKAIDIVGRDFSAYVDADVIVVVGDEGWHAEYGGNEQGRDGDDGAVAAEFSSAD